MIDWQAVDDLVYTASVVVACVLATIVWVTMLARGSIWLLKQAVQLLA